MPTVDELLGTPTVDDILGAPLPLADRDEDTQAVADAIADRSPVGRVLDAFGQGAKAGWGARPLGLGPETEKALRDFGVFDPVDTQTRTTLRTFNEAIIRPSAAALDTGLRSVSSVATGLATGVQAIAEALGEDQGMAARLGRDTLMILESAGIVTGFVPLKAGRAPLPRTQPEAAAARVEKAPEPPRAPVAPEGPPAAVPPAPTATLPPAEAVVDKAGNINLNRIAAPEDVKVVIRDIAQVHGGFVEARRGTITLAETESMAEALGMDAARLAKRKIGETFNAEEITAARTLLVQSATDVRALAVKAKGGSDADLLAFQQSLVRHQSIQEEVSGLTAEAGRALSAFRIMAGATREAQELGRTLETLGGRAKLEDVAAMVAELDTPAKVSRFAMDARTAKTSDIVIEAWINALLSGPQTHVVNNLSNALTALWTIPETALAATIGRLHAGERVFAGEAWARAYGIGEGAKEGIVAAWRTFRTEEPSGGVGKIEVARARAIPGPLGQVVRIPGRALMASDALFKLIGYRQQIHQLAYRQAASEGLRGDAFANRVADLLTSPTDDMVKAARHAAEVQTFTAPLGVAGRSVQAWSNSHPAAKLVLPFVRTPINLVKFAAERSIAAPIMKDVRDNLAGRNGPIARDEAISRVVLGSMVSAGVVGLANEGAITGGGPKDPEQRAMLRATGWQPNSVRIGDTWVSYNRLDPLGVLLGVAADAVEISKAMTKPEADDIAALIFGSVTRNLVNKTWLKGPSDLIEAVNDPDRYGSRWVNSMAGTLIPTGIAQVARADDPVLREAQNVVDSVKSRIPGLSTTLFPKRDVWGEEIVREGAVGPDILSPFYTSRERDDPISRELVRLEIWPSKLQRKVRGVELTDGQYDDYARVAGRLSRQMLTGIVGGEGWDQLPAFAQSELITRTISRARESARSWLILTYPEIAQKALDAKVKQLRKEAPAAP